MGTTTRDRLIRGAIPHPSNREIDMEPKHLTIKQAVAYLATTDTPYKLPTIRAAILAGDLPKYDDPDHPPYILVRQDELEAWAQKQAAKPQGNPQFGKDFLSKRKAQP
jgi:hypothetical protein